MDPRFLALERFGQRAHLPAVARDHRPTDSGGSVADSLAEQVAIRWADLLGVQADDLVLCASASDAWSLLARCVLAPGDVALIAQPLSVEIPAAIVGCGGKFVDVGRTVDGQVDHEVLRAAQARHPDAVLALPCPAWGGADDLGKVAADASRMVLVDARDVESPFGDAGAVNRGADAAVVALRDPSDLASPILHAVVCAPDSGVMVAAIAGPGHLPLALLRAALDTVTLWRARPDAVATLRVQLQARRTALTLQIPEKPGVSLQCSAGTKALVWCLDGDGAAVSRPLRLAGWDAVAWSAHPMRGGVTVDLLRR